MREETTVRVWKDEKERVDEVVRTDLVCVEEHIATVRLEGAPRLEGAAQHMLLAGGKRLRPLLTCCVMRAVGADPAPWARVIAAVELIHSGSLLHDDVIDGSETRRGRRSAHTIFDVHTAILAGDFLLAVALDRLAESAPRDLQRAAAAAIMAVCQGEVLEREALFNAERPVEDVRRVNHLKTAVLFGYAAEAGAILAGSTEKQRRAARNFGEALGDAFQTVDDILDWEGDTERMGKPLGRDLWGGLVTVPVALACGQAQRVKKLVQEIFDAEKHGHKTPFSFEEVREAIREVGGFEKARALAGEDIQRAIQALHDFPPGPWRSWLEEVALREAHRSF